MTIQRKRATVSEQYYVSNCFVTHSHLCQGICIPYFTDEEMGAQKHKWLSMTAVVEYSNLESVSATPEGVWEKVLFPEMPDSLCGCWWPTLIPGQAESLGGMRATVDYETRNSVSGTRWVTGLSVQGQKRPWWWVTEKALSPGVELNIKLGTLCMSTSEGTNHRVLFWTSEEGPYGGWLCISLWYQHGIYSTSNYNTVYGVYFLTTIL